MCGIAGAAFFDVSQRDVDHCLDQLGHRGPDGHGVYGQKDVTLCHTRLAIIDLSDYAAQPMSSVDGRYTIVFNGEIYNYRALRQGLETTYSFTSQSDTEVILALYIRYGEAALEKLRGMFAFAIWDRDRECLFVARDRLGVKPLYFASSGERFAFASRPRPLTCLMGEIDRSIDPQAVRYFLEAGYVPAPMSIFRGMRKLEPGHCLVVTREGVEKKCYWTLDAVGTDTSLEHAKEDDLLDQLDSLIDEAVRLRLVSDVPVGAFLSGGIDSSLVAAYMVKNSSSRVKTFSIGFQEKSFDESIYAAQVAASLGTDHSSEILLVDDLIDLIPTFTQQFDEPFFDYSAFPVMAVSRLARKSVVVSLSGDGGDEAFGGYHYYSIMQILELSHRVPPFARVALARALRQMPKQRLNWIGTILAEGNPSQAYAFIRGVIKDAGELMQPALLRSTQSLGDLFTLRTSSMPQNLTYAEQAMRLDQAYTLPDDYLQKVDVGSMAFSLEARDPLLDHTLVEWAARLPLSWKIRNKTQKYLLRQLAYRKIPRALLDRKKMGFSLPMAQWLRNGLKEWAEELLGDREAFDALQLDGPYVQKLWADHQAGRVQSHTALWSVLVLLRFYRSQQSWR